MEILTLNDFKPYNTVIVNKTVWNQYKDKHSGKKGSGNRPTYIWTTKMPSGESVITFSKKRTGTIGHPHTTEMNPNSYLMPFTKIYLKCVTGLNVKHETMWK